MTPEKNPEGGFMNSNEKNEKSVPIEADYPTNENAGSSLIRQWKKGTTLTVGDLTLARNEEKRTFGNRSVKIRIFPTAKTHDMYDYLKPLLEKSPDNIILYVGTNNSVNETLSLKNSIENLCPTCKVTVSNLVYRSDNGKASLTMKNINDYLDAINIDLVGDRNIGRNYLDNSDLH